MRGKGLASPQATLGIRIPSGSGCCCGFLSTVLERGPRRRAAFAGMATPLVGPKIGALDGFRVGPRIGQTTIRDYYVSNVY